MSHARFPHRPPPSSPAYLRTHCLRQQVSAGGEPIDSVAGRQEEAEFPVYQKGAFSIVGSSAGQQQPACSVNVGTGRFHAYLENVMRSLEFPASMGDNDARCDLTIRGLTLAITRYEYANLYHTMTDWYNAYQAWMMSPYFSPSTPPTVLFLDGHSSGSLDEMWVTLFGAKPIYMSSLSGYERVCFEHFGLIPPGYTSALGVTPTMGVAQDCRLPAQIPAFASHVLTRLGIDPKARAAADPSSPKRILYIFRRDYLAHPRIGARHASRKIANEDELMHTTR